MPTIRLPIKCSTARECANAVDATINAGFDGFDKVMTLVFLNRWSIRILKFLWKYLWIPVTVVVSFVIGTITLGTILEILLGYGHQLAPAHPEILMEGGIIGIPIGLFLAAIGIGYLKLECLHDTQKDPATLEMEENEDLVRRAMVR
jgi:hypothetical protein